MSTPKGVKNLWNNIDWKSKDEKRAFFNKYFGGGELVKEEIEKVVKSVEKRLIIFIEAGEIREGGKARDINNDDIIKRIREEVGGGV